ncbi:hypothetical protein E1B28_009460 [Marasmius oreades]|uniref:Uncharacterized protein n=1 Tax=Marasmius oreades TaxID=181124 RepID=A0A9P7RVU6_9AGAR|nr:uncharacterized protein E1B28_009460 [Marasmius oreades]KAG7090340.1 hypothetical protein E1B28_009460 [Marasmius oreades]
MGRQTSGMEAGQLHIWRVNLGAEILYSMLIPVMGIASTLIIVRAALGLAIQDEETFRETILSDFRVAVVTTMSERSVLDMRPTGSQDTQYRASVDSIMVELESQSEKRKIVASR